MLVRKFLDIIPSAKLPVQWRVSRTQRLLDVETHASAGMKARLFTSLFLKAGLALFSVLHLPITALRVLRQHFTPARNGKPAAQISNVTFANRDSLCGLGGTRGRATATVTGSCGLIGSELCHAFHGAWLPNRSDLSHGRLVPAAFLLLRERTEATVHVLAAACSQFPAFAFFAPASMCFRSLSFSKQIYSNKSVSAARTWFTVTVHGLV